MIHDYKFDAELRSSLQKRKRKNRALTIALSLVVAGFAASAAWHFNGKTVKNVAEPELAQMELPAKSETPASASQTRTQNLALPKHETSRHYTSAADKVSLSLLSENNSAPIPSMKEKEDEPSLLKLAKFQPVEKPEATPERSTFSFAQGLKYMVLGKPEKTEPVVEKKSEPTNTAAKEKAEEVVAKIEKPKSRWIEHKIGSGDSLSRIFKKYKLSASVLHKIVYGNKISRGLADIRPGQTLRFKVGPDNKLEKLVYHRNEISSLHIKNVDGAYLAENINRDVEKRVATASGVIQSSLFLDGQKGGLSDNQIMELSNIFGWDIDFVLEIRAGDEFKVVYEEHFLDGKKIDNGPILAAEFTNRGKTYRALRFEARDGDVNYYSPDGHSKRRAFIRSPIKYARVSSGFTKRRWHPVLKKWRSHKGVDYAAPKGTPIKSTGTGKVIFRGWKNGYGNVVIIQHGSKYKTLYAHLSKFSKHAKKGKRVKQGAVIGYVGATGLATGPHLHYEFRVNDVHRNPLRVKLPKSIALARSEIPAFKRQTRPLLARLSKIPSNTMLAKADTGQ